MRLKAYSVFDHKVLAFMPPFYCRTDGEAIRTFSDAVNDPKAQFGKYPADYTLMAIAVFDDEKGIFEQPNTGPEMLMKATEVDRSPDPFSRPAT